LLFQAFQGSLEHGGIQQWFPGHGQLRVYTGWGGKTSEYLPPSAPCWAPANRKHGAADGGLARAGRKFRLRPAGWSIPTAAVVFSQEACVSRLLTNLLSMACIWALACK
jgi:hypothetical protein